MSTISEMLWRVTLLLALLLTPAMCVPAASAASLRHEEGAGHGAVSELTQHAARGASPRLPLPLPGPQEIEAIKKVAQILAMLGEQIIPAIVGGEAQSVGGESADA